MEMDGNHRLVQVLISRQRPAAKVIFLYHSYYWTEALREDFEKRALLGTLALLHLVVASY